MRRATASSPAGLRRLWGGAAGAGEAVAERVSEILGDVERRGDAALLEWTLRLDGARLTRNRLRVKDAELRFACADLEPALLAALRESALRIERFAARTLPPAFELGTGSGIRTGQRVVPVDSAGLYAPGGRASYPSTVLMNALPARVAGVPRRVLVTPPDSRGRVAPLVCAAALESGVHEVYRVGGAQAVAALVFGTGTIAPVATLAGPGNAYVTEAKRQLMGRAGMDGLAGPSELLVLADETADGAIVAGRLLAQAEHDPLTRVGVISTSEAVLRRVRAELSRALPRAARSGILKESLARGLLVLASTSRQACDAVNELAPEHLEIHTREPRVTLEAIRNAGAVFLGAGTPTALGDYGAGPNHTLPTGRTARFSSALSAAHFVRTMPLVEVEGEGDAGFFKGAARLARAEGLVNHAESLAGRISRPRRKGAS